ncbi:MAG: hemerythrin domain-containing protein, partial [Pseudoxanthomonas sp.]
MARDILVTLRTEHDALRALFDQINATTDRAKKKRADLLKHIEAALIPHAKWEEFHFYPAFKERA